MNTELIKDKVISIIGNYVNINKQAVSAETNVKTELGLNSMEFLYFVSDIENDFNILIDEADIPKMFTVSDMVWYISSKLSVNKN
jgi:acyl carrier protein